MTEAKLVKKIHDCIVEIYKNADPPADFNELKEKSPRDEDGKIRIPFMDYTIKSHVLTGIVNKYNKKLRPRDKASFNMAIYLGPTPKQVD